MSKEPTPYVAQPPRGLLDDAVLLAAARERASYLARASKQLAGSLSADRAARRALQVCVPAFAEWAQLQLPAERGVRFVALRAGAGERFRVVDVGSPAASGLGGAGRVLATGRPELVPVTGEALDDLVPVAELREAVHDVRPDELAVLPLNARGRTFGALTLARRPGTGFEPEELAFAAELAARMAVALDAAQVHAEQAKAADALAASMRVPALPDTPGLSIGLRLRAGNREGGLGGDFFDVVGGPGDWTVLLGDVIGAEAAAAAVLIGQVRHTVRGAAFFNRDPGELLRVLNATLTDSPERNDPARLLTAICVRVRSREGGKLAVTLAAAGHPQPMLVRGDGKVEEVPVTGRLCGALPSTAYEETAALLSGEDLLLLFTGGVPDAKGADGRFGRGRLAQLASGYAGAGAQALAEAVDIAVAEFSATDPAIPVDDVSVVALGPGGGSQR